MHSPHVMGIPYMTNKQRNKKKMKQNAKKAKKTPFADVGEILGGAVGSLFGLGGAKGVGRWLGSGIGSIFGSGDYQMVGTPPGYNVLANGKQIPKFEANDRTNVICHREFMGDVKSSILFKNNSFVLNPSDIRTFPWLSAVAKNYQQYRFHGMIFEFRPMITDFVTGGQPGVVVFATNYNASEPLFRNKVEMENSEFAVSVKPTHPLMHAIECAPSDTTITKLYVDRETNNDPRFTDLGVTQFATQGYSSDGVILGELWVSYCVEFFKPKLNEEVGGVSTAHITRTIFTDVNYFGATADSSSGDIPFEINAATLAWKPPPNTKWMITINWIGSVAGTLTTITPSFVNLLSSSADWKFANGLSSIVSPLTGVSSTRVSYSVVVVAQTDLSNPTASLGFSAMVGLPTGTTTLDITLSQLDTSAV